VDHLHLAVAHDLSSRYCPHSKAIFLTRFWTLFALFAAVALAVFSAARKRTSARMPLYIIAGIFLLFALGSGALVLYGLSGCSGAAAEGLIWDWP
jgi:predicted anti-sigma-YlaC factor YlaD